MKVLAIILVSLLLMLGMGVPQATADSYASSNVAVSASDQEPLRNDHRSEATLVFNTDPDADNDGIYPCHPMTVFGYALSPRVTIDLQCRLVPAEENGSESLDRDVDEEYITQNLLLGFSYKF